MGKVGDLSWARPGGAALKQHGFEGVMRYFSNDTGKNLSHDELVDYLTNGLGVGVVWESTANRGLSGAAGGTVDGQTALAEAKAIGYTGKIYAAYDFDANDAQKPVLAEYQKAFDAVVGGAGRAGYGGYWVIKYLFDNNLIDFGWQTVAWSGGNVDERACLLQDATNDFGGQVDNNQVLKSNYGAMGAGSTPPTPSPSPAPAPVATDSYTVVKNDTLSGIAQRFGTTYQALAALNGIADPSKIYPGDVIKLHGGSPAPISNNQTYTVTAHDADGLAAAMSRIGISDWQSVARANGLQPPYTIYVNQVLRLPGTNAVSAPAAQGVVYVVQANDNLSTIASRYGTTYQHLAQINGIPDPDKIYPGQSIRIS